MKEKNDNRAVFGALLILFGLGVLFNNLDIFPYRLERILFSWKTLLVALGALIAYGKKERTTGMILMGVGAFFLLPDLLNFLFPDLNLYSLSFRKLFWPAVLIVVGVFILRKNYTPLSKSTETGDLKDGDIIDEMVIFGGGEIKVSSQNFSGGNVTSIFAGSEIDFTNAKLAEGTHVIEVLALFAGCEIIVPADWDVKIQMTSILGGVTDSRLVYTNYVVEPKRELVIKGTACFGGCEIRNSKRIK